MKLLQIENNSKSGYMVIDDSLVFFYMEIDGTHYLSTGIQGTKNKK